MIAGIKELNKPHWKGSSLIKAYHSVRCSSGQTGRIDDLARSRKKGHRGERGGVQDENNITTRIFFTS